MAAARTARTRKGAATKPLGEAMRALDKERQAADHARIGELASELQDMREEVDGLVVAVRRLKARLDELGPRGNRA